MLFSQEYYRDLISKLGLPEMPILKVFDDYFINSKPISFNLTEIVYFKASNQFTKILCLDNTTFALLNNNGQAFLFSAKDKSFFKL